MTGLKTLKDFCDFNMEEEFEGLVLNKANLKAEASKWVEKLEKGCGNCTFVDKKNIVNCEVCTGKILLLEDFFNLTEEEIGGIKNENRRRID